MTGASRTGASRTGAGGTGAGGTGAPRPGAGRGVGAWAGLLWPACCPGCGTPEEVVCPACRRRLLGGPPQVRTLADGTRVVASTGFRGPARGLVSAGKEQGRSDVGRVLGLALARAVAQVAWGPGRTTERLLLVAPPSRAAAVLRRRDRPAQRLAGTAAGLLRGAGADVGAADLLRLARRVRDQAGLDRAARLENVAGAFAWRAVTVPRVDVVVVDDVLTTGATLSEVAATLRRAGVPVVGAAVVAGA